METIQAKTIIGSTPQHIIQAFRYTYTFEEVQEELWRCIQPRLLESFNDLNPDSTNHIATFYENIEILFSALYQLPDLSAPEGTAPVTTNRTGDQRHV